MKLVFLGILCCLSLSKSWLLLPATRRSDGTCGGPRCTRSTVAHSPAFGNDNTRLICRVAAYLSLIVTSTVNPVFAALPPVQTMTASVFDSNCFGFGCNAFGDPSFSGLSEAAVKGEDTISFAEFLKALDSNLVERVDFTGNLDTAYATLILPASPAGPASSLRIRIGQGFPIENGRAWSSPLWVVRILADKQIPYSIGYKLGTVGRTKEPLRGKQYSSIPRRLPSILSRADRGT